MKPSIKRQIDEIVNPYVKSRKHLCLTIGIVTESSQEVLGYGSTNCQFEDVMFEIGSITKVITATLLALLVRKGLVSYDDSIERFLPTSVQVPKFNGRSITLRHLATHTSGLPRLPDNLDISWKNMDNPYENYTVDDLYRFLSTYQLRREIGQQYEYSNLGMALLGHLLANHLGCSYEEAVRTHICHPLGMNSTRINLTDEQKQMLAPGHTSLGDPAVCWTSPTFQGDGALFSNTRDMMKWITVNLGLVNHPLANIVQDCHTPQFPASIKHTSVALGWHVSTWKKGGLGEVLWHNGATGGYTSFLGLEKSRKTGVIVLSNYTLPFLQSFRPWVTTVNRIGAKVLQTVVIS